jgi:alanine racemase
MSRPTYMKIDLRALAHNFERVRDLAKGRSIIAMVKANAYGHGITRIAHALPNADAFGVASLEEGVILRDAGITQPIVLVEGVFYPEEMAEAAKHHFSLVVHHLPHLEMLEQAKVDEPFTVWLKINTGMNRLGINPLQFEEFYQRLLAADAVKKPIGLMTHFASADLINDDATLKQLELFNQVTANHQGPRSLANSAAIIAWPKTHGDWVRPGLMLYGASPFADKIGRDFDLQPVMSLCSRLIAITQVKKGGKIGYDGTYTAPEDMLIGVVGVGYGDGYPQFAKNGTPTRVNGVECPLAGRVSMDMLTVDLRHQPNAKMGDPVVLWGDGLPVERVASFCNTSAYEILTRMTPRPRVEVAADHD